MMINNTPYEYQHDLQKAFVDPWRYRALALASICHFTRAPAHLGWLPNPIPAGVDGQGRAVVMYLRPHQQAYFTAALDAGL